MDLTVGGVRLTSLTPSSVDAVGQKQSTVTADHVDLLLVANYSDGVNFELVQSPLTPVSIVAPPAFACSHRRGPR